MAFEGLTEKLQNAFKKLTGKGKLNEQNIKDAMREVRMALLEADVNYTVVKDFTKKVSERCIGTEVLSTLNAGQQVIKIVNEELTQLMGGTVAKLTWSPSVPTIYMLCGLQGAGKTTMAGKLATYLVKQGKKPLLAACDIYRPAAIKQLQIVGEQAHVPVFEKGTQDPVKTAKEAVEYARYYGQDVLIIDTAGRLHVDEALMDELKASIKRKYSADDAGQPWEVKDVTYGAPVNSGLSLKAMLSDASGKYVGSVDFDDPRWETLLNEITVDEMKTLVGYGAFRTNPVGGVDGIINKPMTTDADGPSGFTSFLSESVIYNTCAYQAECVMGATWNVELAERMGQLVGEEGLIGNEKGDGLPYTGWYAPAVNIHRSPFAGRNWEYYSEDGVLSGKFAAKVIDGAAARGVYCYVKHFAVNDQETDREYNGILVWANEQAMRELYLKPFEIAVKTSATKVNGMMSSFNRIGMRWAGGSYPLLTAVLRNEWGARGPVITDYSLNTYTHVDEMIRAGGDLFLTQDAKTFNKADDATQITLLRNATKNVLYAVVNSNAMGAEIIGYQRPMWQNVMFIIDAALVVLLGLWGFLAFRKAKKRPVAAGKKAK